MTCWSSDIVAAAKRLMRKLLKCHGRPRVMMTDKLRVWTSSTGSTGAEQPNREFAPAHPHPREGHAGFKLARQLLRLASVHAQASDLFMGCRYHRDVQQKRVAQPQAT
ncbi:hypothetical protein Bpla01_63950 [Burkholderia plantarii]|nr:hypothetical protein Bpla01_63950 [Burkholderia plantarii]